MNSDKLPVDVRQRARGLLSMCNGGSVGKSVYVCGIAITMLVKMIIVILFPTWVE